MHNISLSLSCVCVLAQEKTYQKFQIHTRTHTEKKMNEEKFFLVFFSLTDYLSLSLSRFLVFNAVVVVKVPGGSGSVNC